MGDFGPEVALLVGVVEAKFEALGVESDGLQGLANDQRRLAYADVGRSFVKTGQDGGVHAVSGVFCHEVEVVELVYVFGALVHSCQHVVHLENDKLVACAGEEGVGVGKQAVLQSSQLCDFVFLVEQHGCLEALLDPSEHLQTCGACACGLGQQLLAAEFVAVGHGFAWALFAAIVALFARRALLDADALQRHHIGVVDVVGGRQTADIVAKKHPVRCALGDVSGLKKGLFRK